MTDHKSEKQAEIFEFIKHQIKEKGYPPSVREICAAVGLRSTSTVHGHLESLEERGLIRKDPTKPRTIEVIDNSVNKKEMINVPIIGTITAGSPILAVESIEDIFPISVDFVKTTNELFILKVSGDSMIDAGIFHGDFAIIEKTSSAENTEIVVALIENEATLKRFFKEENHIRLQPENKDMSPIIISDCQILGKLVAIYRQY
jgi:repressor LexA